MSVQNEKWLDFLRSILHVNHSVFTRSPYQLLYILWASCVCFLRVKTTDIPKKHKWAHLGPLLGIIFLLSLEGTITHNAGKQLADYFLPLIRRELLQNRRQESFLQPWDKRRVRRSCAFVANTCPVATREPLPQFPVGLPLIICPRRFPLCTQCIVQKI